VVERGGLENRCASLAYPGFESLSLRLDAREGLLRRAFLPLPRLGMVALGDAWSDGASTTTPSYVL
jgi:hypothetical protein